MPSPVTAKWPKPRSEDEWEDMVMDAMSVHWKCPNIHRNGRRGQRQNGVDVYGYNTSGWVAAQAKNSESVSIEQIKRELLKATFFEPPLAELYFAISGNRDSELQRSIRLLTEENIPKISLPIFVFFFEDICNILAAEPRLTQKYWGMFAPSLLSELSNILSNSFVGPILSIDSAIERITAMPEFQSLAQKIDERSSGLVKTVIEIERAPNLEFDSGTIERSWILNILESTPEHALSLWRIAVDVDSGKTKFLSIVDNCWLEHHEWLKTQPWFVSSHSCSCM